MNSLKKVLIASTLGEPQRMYPMIRWSILEALFKGTPVTTLLFAVWILLIPLIDPTTSLQWWQVIAVEVSFLIGMLLFFLISLRTYSKTFSDGYQITADGRIRLANQMRQLPMGFYNKRDPGEIGEYMSSDYGQVEFLITHFIPQAISGYFVPLITLIFFTILNWKIGLLATSVIILSYPLFYVSGRLISHLGVQLQTVKRNTSSRMIEYVLGIKLIKAFNLGGTAFTRLEHTVNELKRQSIRVELLPSPIISLAGLLLNLGTVLVALFGFLLMQRGEISLLLYVMFLLTSLSIYAPLLQSFQFNALIQFLSLSSDRIYDLVRLPVQEQGAIETVESTDLELSHISFSYNEQAVLEDVDMHIPAKSFIALVGPSGSGKTTITRLIARFWDPDAGKISLGGRDLRDYTIDALLSQIAVVFQDVYLFHDTIKNNILIGKEDATDAEIEAAARKAQCHDFIMKLPKGYDTEVGEGGSSLSGGEKQRISIARAILKEASIVLLDEATASLDPENEIHIQEAISQLVKDKTVVVIAHRLWTVREADQIYVLDKGRVVQHGKHDELLAQTEGVYRHLWDEQQRIKGWKF